MATLHRTLASLNDSQLMNVLREKKRQTLGKTKKSVKNVLITIEHFLVAWESEDCCLLFKNLLEPLDSTSAWANRKNNEKSPTDRFLKISLTDPPVFQVESIQANMDGSLVVLSGPQGVACVELPSNLALLQVNDNTQSEKLAKCSYIDEQLLTCNSKIRIQEVKFHPGSPTNSHLVILTSDNCIRIYDAFHPARPEKTITIGPKISNLSIQSSMTFTPRMDEAVSFDFGTPFEAERKPGRDPSKRDSVPIFLFPVYILLASGDVYTFDCSVQSNSSRAPKISVDGPLMMQPAALDNYGGDACSLLCLPVSPPVLVIANRTGNVHHAVLLPRQFSDGDGSEDSEDDDIKSRIPDDLESLISKASRATTGNHSRAGSVLHVTETLELDGDILENESLGLSTDENTDGSEGILYLTKDPSCSSRYFVTHEFGVHGVVVPLVDTLNELAAKNDQEVNQDDSKRVMLAETVVEFILCSRMKTSAPAPPQGVVLYSLPPTLLVLLDSFDLQVISLSPLLKPVIKTTAPISTTKVVKESFEAQVRRQLQRNHSQPKLSLPPGTELPVTEVVKLFSRSVQTLREEYIMKQDTVREAMEKKTRLLELHLQQQFDELELVRQSKAELTSVAHRLAEKYEDAMECHERVTQRVEKVLLEIQRRSPMMTDAEKQMGIQLRLLESKLNTLRQAMESLKRREQVYGAKMIQNPADTGTTTHLSEEQRTSINDTLTIQSEDITALLRTLQQAKKKLAAS